MNAIWHPRGNGIPKSWFSELPHWELRATKADGARSVLLREFPRVDYDAADVRFWQEERERELEHLAIRQENERNEGPLHW